MTSTVTGTRPPPGGQFKATAASTVTPLPPGKKPPKGEVERRCPYIKTGLNQDKESANSVASIEGNRIYRTTVLTTLRPVGCRFYFYAPPYEATVEIAPRTLDTAAQARDAMIATAATGRDNQGVPNFVPGVDGITYKTRFFGKDGDRDGAFVFAKGRIMVVIRTQDAKGEPNPLYLGRAIAGKF